MKRDFDGPWKWALQLYLPSFLEVFLPRLHAQVDWSQPYRSLDAELQKVQADLAPSKVIADRLFEVQLLGGDVVWLIIHIEIQSQRDESFLERMFDYRYWIRRKFGKPVKSIAILGDDDPDWRPSEYRVEEFGDEIRFRFSTLKLLDFADQRESLLADPLKNPIGFVVAAHLDSLRCKSDFTERFRAKKILLMTAYERGLTGQVLQQMYKLIDWLLQLPKEFELQLESSMATLIKESEDRYWNCYLQDGYEKGIREGHHNTLRFLLEFKFGTTANSLLKRIQAIEDIAILERLIDDLRTTGTLSEFEARLPQ